MQPQTIMHRHVRLFYLATVTALLVSIVVVALVATWSRLNSFPDEGLHVLTTNYYFDHWLPPRIDASIGRYTGNYGFTYLAIWPPQICYLIAAKVALIARSGGGAEHVWIVYRAAQVALWGVLVVLVLRHLRRHPALILLIGVTPGVWYLFTYFSADASSYAVSALLAMQLAVPESVSRRFLATGTPRRGALLLGLLIGLLCMSKLNYGTFGVFAAIYVCVVVAQLGRPGWLRLGAAAAIAVALAGPFVVMDAVRNAVDREARTEALRQEFAWDGFKPTDIAAGTAYYGLGLRERGVSAMALFHRPWRWGELTSRGMLGVYGTNDLHAPRWLYSLQIVSVIFLLWRLLRRPLRPFPRVAQVLTALAVTLGFLTFFASFWRAWTFDFQAQGRYVFAVIPILTMIVHDSAEPADESLTWAASLALVVLGLASFGIVLPRMM